jgi:hypothetical protein
MRDYSGYHPDLSKTRPWACECGNSYRTQKELSEHRNPKRPEVTRPEGEK